MMELNPVDALRRAFPELSETALFPLATLTRQRHYAPGTLICREGALGETFYIIGKGEVEFTKRFTAGEERLLRTGGPGVYFGEMALVQRSPRNANVRALTEVILLEIDRDGFTEAIQANPAMMLDIMRTLIERMRSNDAAALDEMRAQKEQIQDAYDQLQFQETLRSEFLTSLAHELRTPLTTATGYMQLLRTGMMAGPTLGMGLEKVSASLNRIVSLVNDFLFAQEQDLIESALLPVSLPALIEIVAGELAEKASQQGVQIILDVPPDLPTLQADPDGLARAFAKLLENAIKFSPDGGDIEIVARAHDNWIVVEFADHGVGISEMLMPRLFERFARADRIGDRVFEGLGLGLPIAKHIIEGHGGSIAVTSAEGVGSTFTIRLPLDAGH